MKTPFLIGKRCYLRPLEESDVNDDYVGWFNDQEVTRYLGMGKFPISREGIRASVEERFRNSTANLILAIADRKTDLHIGNAALNHINWIHRTADTGLVIGRKEFWGKGYASEAWSLLIRHAFDALNLHKLIATVVAGHDGSQKALEKLGFKVEGRSREEFYLEGAYLDYIRLGLLGKEFKPVV